eukprot:GHVU01159879.1.p1 GENE.GHVU01159879.1~~GHVU01159879.1.p1  ORF type:complete len:1235 (-),score=275.82 GHVU01159879.1:84-3605(-)
MATMMASMGDLSSSAPLAIPSSQAHQGGLRRHHNHNHNYPAAGGSVPHVNSSSSTPSALARSAQQPGGGALPVSGASAASAPPSNFSQAVADFFTWKSAKTDDREDSRRTAALAKLMSGVIPRVVVACCGACDPEPLSNAAAAPEEAAKQPPRRHNFLDAARQRDALTHHVASLFTLLFERFPLVFLDACLLLWSASLRTRRPRSRICALGELLLLTDNFSLITYLDVAIDLVAHDDAPDAQNHKLAALEAAATSAGGSGAPLPHSRTSVYHFVATLLRRCYPQEPNKEAVWERLFKLLSAALARPSSQPFSLFWLSSLLCLLESMQPVKEAALTKTVKHDIHQVVHLLTAIAAKQGKRHSQLAASLAGDGSALSPLLPLPPACDFLLRRLASPMTTTTTTTHTHMSTTTTTRTRTRPAAAHSSVGGSVLAAAASRTMLAGVGGGGGGGGGAGTGSRHMTVGAVSSNDPSEVAAHLALCSLAGTCAILRQNTKRTAVASAFMTALLDDLPSRLLPALYNHSTQATNLQYRYLVITLLTQLPDTKTFPGFLPPITKTLLDVLGHANSFQTDRRTLHSQMLLLQRIVRHAASDSLEALLPTPAAGVFVTRDADSEMKARHLKRQAFLVYSCPHNTFHAQLSFILERIVELLRNPSPVVYANVFLTIRILLLRISAEHLTPLWPLLISELLRLFSSTGKWTNASDPHTAPPHMLDALKVVDLASLLDLPEFLFHRWLFVTDLIAPPSRHSLHLPKSVYSLPVGVQQSTPSPLEPAFVPLRHDDDLQPEESASFPVDTTGLSSPLQRRYLSSAASGAHRLPSRLRTGRGAQGGDGPQPFVPFARVLSTTRSTGITQHASSNASGVPHPPAASSSSHSHSQSQLPLRSTHSSGGPLTAAAAAAATGSTGATHGKDRPTAADAGRRPPDSLPAMYRMDDDSPSNSSRAAATAKAKALMMMSSSSSRPTGNGRLDEGSSRSSAWGGGGGALKDAEPSNRGAGRNDEAEKAAAAAEGGAASLALSTTQRASSCSATRRTLSSSSRLVGGEASLPAAVCTTLPPQRRRRRSQPPKQQQQQGVPVGVQQQRGLIIAARLEREARAGGIAGAAAALDAGAILNTVYGSGVDLTAVATSVEDDLIELPDVLIDWAPPLDAAALGLAASLGDLWGSSEYVHSVDLP